MKIPSFLLLIGGLGAACVMSAQPGPALLEKLDRGVVALRTSNSDTYVGWRLLGTDPAGISFNVYRQIGGGTPSKLNSDPLTATTDFVDSPGAFNAAITYTVVPVISGAEQPAGAGFTLPPDVAQQSFLSVPLQIPPGGINPDGAPYTYNANDCSVGDLDGDGRYEIIVKWDPSNAQDNSFSGFTGNVYLDAYTLDGARLWRIDLGKNIRAGAHYTQFLVYDFDGDGRAELVCKTAPGTKDGSGAFIAQTGKFIGTPTAPIDHAADYRNSSGYILTGPEFFTVFDGLTGNELATTNYPVPRNNDPSSADVTAWGDNYGNRVDRFLAGVAYLDGQRPSILLCRGYYTRATVAAIDWRGGKLTQRWLFDTGHTGTPSPWANWRGQGAHSLTIGDVDGDGRDEIIYGAAAIDDHGGGLYSTLWGHGDALHMSDMLPSRPGLEVWMVHESPASYGANGGEFRDARTGALIFGVDGQGADVGRGVAIDIDPAHPGYEMWASRGGIMSATGAVVAPSSVQKPGINFAVWWDADLSREILDGTTISKWDPVAQTASVVLSPAGISSNNGTKSTPALSADLFGDWREEVMWRTSDNSALRIYSTTIPANNRLVTLMHDRQYRLAIAWQNVAYNQPPHPGFFLGSGMSAQPPPNIVTSLAELGSLAPAVVAIDRYNPSSAEVTVSSVTFRVTFNVPVTGVDASDFTVITTGTATGGIASVTAASGQSYDVVVNGIAGEGLVRLDLNAAGTAIVDTTGTPISGGFNSGQTYLRTPPANGTWINPAGGTWSTATNWDGPVADGTGNTANFTALDLSGDITVALDTARTIGNLAFADIAAASPGSWIISDNGNAANRLTLDLEAGSPSINVGALGTNSAAILGVSLNGSDGLTKTGAGILAFQKENSIAGTLNISAGRLRIDAGGSLSSGVVTIASGGAILNVAGGDFTATSTLTVSAGGGSAVVVDAGNASFATLATSNSAGGIIRVNGGVVTATSVNLPRSNDNSTAFGAGLIVAGGSMTVNGTVGIGTGNSYGVMSIEGGNLLATGNIRIGDLGSNSTRGGVMRVTAGSLTTTDTAGGGLVFANGNANTATGLFSGGVTTAEVISLGGVNNAAGSATLTVNGGAVYLGSGGLIKRGASTMTAVVNLNSGTLGAKADWTTLQPLVLTAGGNINLRAADADGVPHNIVLNGALTGAGGFTKTGTGTVTVTKDSTFSGTVQVAAGVLQLNAQLTAADGSVQVTGGTLAGNGESAKPVALATNGTVAPVGVLSASAMSWQRGGRLAVALGSSDTHLELDGALTKDESGVGGYEVAVTQAAGFGPGAYTVATFGSTTFSASDFIYSGLGGHLGAFAVTPSSLKLFVAANGPAAKYDLWTYLQGIPDGVRAAQDDADGDGVMNLLEFVLAQDPNVPGGGGLKTTTISTGGQTYPGIVYLRRSDIGGVQTAVQIASNLSFSALHAPVLVSAAQQGDGTELVTVRSSVSLATAPDQFFRLTATIPSL